MKRRVSIASACVVFAAATASALVACVDLFHSTSFETLCDVDASAPGCGQVDAAPEAAAEAASDATVVLPTDFCALSSAEAASAATHACAWLGACEGPYEQNPFGQCVFNALQVFDCSIRPNMKVHGAIFDYWRCLSTVKSCADVDKCVYPAAPPLCPGDSGSFSACGADGVTRVACSSTAARLAHPTFVASCGAEGRKCVTGSGTASFCAASDTTSGACTSGCDGTTLHDCEDAGLPYPVDLGRDCANVGAGACAATNGAFCTPSGASTSACATVDGGLLGCDPDAGTTVIDCRSGFADLVDCSKYAAACQLGNVTGWDPSTACAGTNVGTLDHCNGTKIVGYANGIEFDHDCVTDGLAGCSEGPPVPVGADYGSTAPTEQLATCTRP